MVRGKRWCGIGGGTAMVMALIGCASPAPTASTSAPAPVATPTPAFTSDADAEAAAIAFYKRYLAVSAQVAESQTSSFSPLRSYFSSQESMVAEAEFKSLRDAGHHLSGPIVLHSYKVQSARLQVGTINEYVCLDNRKARILDKFGRDVTPEVRAQGVTLVVQISGLPRNPVIESSKQWSGPSVCS